MIGYRRIKVIHCYTLKYSRELISFNIFSVVTYIYYVMFNTVDNLYISKPDFTSKYSKPWMKIYIFSVTKCLLGKILASL